MPIYYTLGAISDRYDPRDFIFEATPHRFAIGPIPSLVDLRQWCTPVRDQGQQGYCTGFALTALHEFLEIKSDTPNLFVQLAPTFVHYEERQTEGTTDNCDGGAMIRDGLQALNNTDACPETDDTYSDQICAIPSQQAIDDTTPYTISAYHRITTLGGLKQALAGGDPCIAVGLRDFRRFCV